MTNIILHIGYPKCASTYLQKYVFPLSSSHIFYGKDSYVSQLIKTSSFCQLNDSSIISDESILGEFSKSTPDIIANIKFFLDSNPHVHFTILVLYRSRLSLINSLHAEMTSWGSMPFSLAHFQYMISNQSLPVFFNYDLLDSCYLRQQLELLNCKVHFVPSSAISSPDTLLPLLTKLGISLDSSPVFTRTRKSFHPFVISLQTYFNKLIYSRFNPSGLLPQKPFVFISYKFFLLLDKFLALFL